jgi:hypothetical protein
MNFKEQHGMIALASSSSTLLMQYETSTTYSVQWFESSRLSVAMLLVESRL